MNGWTKSLQDETLQMLEGSTDWPVLLIPIYTTLPNHWTLVVRKESESRKGSFDFFFLDSLHNGNDIRSQSVKNIFLSTDLFEQSRNDTWKMITTTHQHGVDCGAHVCLFSYLANEDPKELQTIFEYAPYYRRFSPGQLRGWITSVILERRMLKPPLPDY